jgi:CheY-like chemotaxis protein
MAADIDVSAPNETPPVANLRILIVEDETMIAILIQESLEELGCEIVALAQRLPSALDAARTKSFDCAILDVNLAGKPVYPVAEILDSRDIPYIFVTGYSAPQVDKRFRAHRILQKPVRFADLHNALQGVTGRSH